MKNGTCPKCGSTETVDNLLIHGGERYPPYVSSREPEPEKRPFVWQPKNEESFFQAYACGLCGYTEFYAQKYQALNEGRKKGFTSS